MDRSLGFYLDTTAPRELALTLDADVPGLNATGRLAFLRLLARDNPAQPTLFHGDFDVDVRGPNRDGKLTFGEMTTGDLDFADVVSATLSGNANVNLLITADFGSANFPSVDANFVMGWGFSNADTGGPLAGFGSTPTVEFRDVRLQLGSFFSRFVGPILQNVNRVLGPIKPLTDVLSARLPVISDLARRHVSLLDIAGASAADTRFIRVVTQLIDLASRVGSLGTTSTVINFGSFNLGSGTDVRRLPNLNNITPNLVGPAPAPWLDQVPEGAARNFLQDLTNTEGRGLEFPLLQSPGSVFRLFLGQNVPLFTSQTPDLRVGFSYSQYFPSPLPFLGVRLTGSIEAAARFRFGFDTYGLRRFVENGGRNADDVLDGFYVDPRASGARLAGSIRAGAELNVGVARAGVEGGLFATVSLGLNDPNRDGVVRFSELAANFDRGPLAIFDAAGDVTARLRAYVQIGKKPFRVKKT